MSYEAMCWAMSQPVTPAITKFVLVAMAECVNASAGLMECWPSYAYLARRTGANAKTVEASMYRLRDDRYIVDTGKREGGTGKVVVYRLNDPKLGGVTSGPRVAQEDKNAGSARLQTPPNTVSFGAGDIPPNPTANPPIFDGESPQKVGVTTPKTGDGIRNGSRNATKKETGIVAIPGVPPSLLSDWVSVRKAKKAGTLTATAVSILTREAEKAGVTVAQAVEYCCGASWQNFNAGFYATREGQSQGRKPAKRNILDLDHSAGVDADGNLI